jgi:hypothetical protein
MLNHEKSKNHHRRNSGNPGCKCQRNQTEKVSISVTEYLEMVLRMENLEEALTIKTADCEMLLKVIASHNKYIFDKAMSDN